MRRYAKKQDRNHTAIKQALEAKGVEVIEILKPLDLLCYYKGYTSFIEVKMAESGSRYTKTQLMFIALTRFPVAIVFNEAEAFDVMKRMLALSQVQKNRIAEMIARQDKPLYTPLDVKKALGYESN